MSHLIKNLKKCTFLRHLCSPCLVRKEKGQNEKTAVLWSLVGSAGGAGKQAAWKALSMSLAASVF
jgi:hypothetical protein